jgi:hypothetical protein
VTGAAASLALRPLFAGARRRLRLVGAGSVAAYFSTDSSPPLLALTVPEAVRLPNAVVVERRALDGIAGVGVLVGAGELTVAGRRLAPVRWWDPRPRLPAVAATALAPRLDALGAALPPWHHAGGPAGQRLRAGLAAFASALEAGDVDRAAAAGSGLVGLGPGLTPAGDDLLAGALAGLALLGGASAAGGGRLAGAILRRLPVERTTALSAALLGHAARGEVADPAGALLVALGRGAAVEAAAAALLSVGHTSGTDLAHGILAGGRAAVARMLLSSYVGP